MNAICLRRKKMGIKAAPHPKAWTAKELALLGMMPDTEVSSLVGRAHAAVRAIRLKLGKPYSKPARKPWTEKELAWLGKMSDREVRIALAGK